MAEMGVGMEGSCYVSAPDILGARIDPHHRKSWDGRAEGVQTCCGFGIMARHTPSRLGLLMLVLTSHAKCAAAWLAPSWELLGTATVPRPPARLRSVLQAR